jgi:hypothetical protein
VIVYEDKYEIEAEDAGRHSVQYRYRYMKKDASWSDWHEFATFFDTDVRALPMVVDRAEGAARREWAEQEPG